MWKAAEIIKQNRWSPFLVAPGRGDAIRALTAPEGVADRLRLVCFAELQARDAFRFGAQKYAVAAPRAWTEAWERFAAVEERHAQMLLDRMTELGIEPGARAVSDKLTRLCDAATDHVNFLYLLSSAEERGMEAGFVLGEQMRAVDAESAAVFARIAEEEIEHVEMAKAALAAFSRDELQARARATNALLESR